MTEEQISKWMKQRVAERKFTDAASLAREFLSKHNITDVLDPQFNMAMDAGFGMAEEIANAS